MKIMQITEVEGDQDKHRNVIEGATMEEILDKQEETFTGGGSSITLVKDMKGNISLATCKNPELGITVIYNRF